MDIDFFVTKIELERGRLEITYGGIVLGCRVLDNDGSRPHVIKPPHVFISGSHWHDFLSIAQAGWLRAKENGER